MHGRLAPLELWVKEALNIGAEIILVHDFQDTATEIELRDMAKRISNPRFKLISKQVNSPGLARNLGLEYVSNKWVTFWDSDDVPIPILYKQMVQEAELNNFNFAVGDFSVSTMDTETAENFQTFGSLINSVNAPGLWRYAIRYTKIKKASFESMKMGEDQLFLAKLNLDDSQVYFFPKVIYNYQIGHSGRLSSDLNAKKQLSQTISRLSAVQKDQGSKNVFTNALLTRLEITQLKNGGLLVKFKAFLRLFAKLRKKDSRSLLIRIVKGI
jgi:glycosyltransferase involved in cell wall biosynthesis